MQLNGKNSRKIAIVTSYVDACINGLQSLALNHSGKNILTRAPNRRRRQQPLLPPHRSA